MSSLPSAPPALGPPPRRARLQLRYRIMRWTLLAAALLPGSCLFGLGRWEHARLNLLRVEGQVAQGIVRDKDVYVGRSASYTVRTAFELDGHRYEGSHSVTRERYESATIGAPVEITYRPSDPDHHVLDRVDAARVERQTSGLVAGSLALFAAFGFTLWIYERYVRRALSLMRNGVVAEGTIEPGKRISYRFVDAEGVEHRGRSAFRNLPPPELVPGARGVVLYDPERPKRSALLASLAQLVIVDSGLEVR
jgi:hypothetical protein